MELEHDGTTVLLDIQDGDPVRLRIGESSREPQPPGMPGLPSGDDPVDKAERWRAARIVSRVYLFGVLSGLGFAAIGVSDAVREPNMFGVGFIVSGLFTAVAVGRELLKHRRKVAAAINIR